MLKSDLATALKAVGQFLDSSKFGDMIRNFNRSSTEKIAAADAFEAYYQIRDFLEKSSEPVKSVLQIFGFSEYANAQVWAPIFDEKKSAPEARGALYEAYAADFYLKKFFEPVIKLLANPQADEKLANLTTTDTIEFYLNEGASRRAWQYGAGRL